MSIDRIGKGGGGPPVSGIDQPGSTSTSGVCRPFDVRRDGLPRWHVLVEHPIDCRTDRHVDVEGRA